VISLRFRHFGAEAGAHDDLRNSFVSIYFEYISDRTILFLIRVARVNLASVASPRLEAAFEHMAPRND
jgi:hypothetical protein